MIRSFDLHSLPVLYYASSKNRHVIRFNPSTLESGHPSELVKSSYPTVDFLPGTTNGSSPWANSKIVTSFSKSSGPRFDRLDGSRMIKEKVLEGLWRTAEFKPCPNTGFSYQFVKAVGGACGWHRGCRSLCDLPRTSLWFAADVGARPRWPCVAWGIEWKFRVRVIYRSNSSSNLSRCVMYLTFHIFSIFFQCLSVSNLGSCSHLENLSFSRSEFNIIKL